ncbi:MAG TPA: hypothetical protein VHE34_05790 [Puia sp.]|uniref:hypothetical protein n=1 Tax=Puia sp. TaxID=2045100 RepID=UPI002C04F909|nr:hypothetical protein [Puia sp.]HVU94713.1 hypothetical protein [Puia sp.]
MRSTKAIILLLMLLLSMSAQWLHYSRAHGDLRQNAGHHASIGERCFFCEHLAFQPTGMAAPGCIQLIVHKEWTLVCFTDIAGGIPSACPRASVNKGPPAAGNV